MGKPVKIAIIASAAQARREISGFQSSMSSAFKTAGKIAAAGAAVAGAAAIKLGMDSIRSASDAQQSMGATETVFGRAADQIVAKSKKAADQVGLSASAYRDAANLMGNSFQNAGVPLQRSVDWSDKLIRRAADMHAAFGKTGDTVADVSDGISAAMRGEYDTLERFGVQLSANKVERLANAAAMRQYGRSVDDLRPKQQDAIKQQAVYQGIMQQSSKVAGQFARESDTLAGKQARLAAKFEDAKAKLGGVLLPVATRFTDLLIKKGVPALEDFATWLDQNSETIEEWARKAGAAGQTFANSVLPSLKTAGEFALTAAQFLDQLPGPLKEIAIQGALAAAVLPKLNAGAAAVGGGIGTGVAKLKQFAAEMTYAEQRAATGKAMLAKLGDTARQVGGGAGLVLLAQGATTANDAVAGLMNVGGGALLGFSMGGPIGAALGAAGGLLLTLKGNADQAKAALTSAADQAEQKWRNYATTLDQATGATTRATKAMAFQNLQDAGALTTLDKLGVSARTAVNATMGRAGASEKVAAAIAAEKSAISDLDSQVDAYNGRIEKAALLGGGLADQLRARRDAIKAEADARRESVAEIEQESGAVRRSITEKQAEIAALTSYSGKLKGLPRGVRTEVKALDVPLNIQKIAELSRRYRLTPKQVKTLVTASGTKNVERDVRKVRNALQETSKTKGSAAQWKRGVERDVAGAARSTARGGKQVGDNLSKGPSKAKVNPGGFLGSIRSMLSKAAVDAGKGGKNVSQRAEKPIAASKANLAQLRGSVASQLRGMVGTASSGGAGVGSALGSGIQRGIAGRVGSIAAQAAAAVRAAIAAARAAAKSNSPSRETMAIGNDMGDGLSLGLAQSAGKAKRAGSKLAREVLAGITAGLSGANKAISAIEKAIRAKIDGKNQAKREKAAIARYRARFNELRKLGKQMDLLDSGNYLARLAKTDPLRTAMTRAGVKNLEEAKRHLADLRQQARDYAQSIRDSIAATGDVTQLGKNEDGTVSIGNLLDQMRDKVKDAKRFDDLITRLRKEGLGEDAIKQMLAAGPEAALATAEAIANGGKASIDEINQMQKELAKVGSSLGDRMADEFYSAGIKAADGIVKGLQEKRAAIEKESERIGKALLAAIKKSLGIKSPSREMQKVMGQTVAGLAFKPHEGYVRRQGSEMSTTLKRGFGEPTMEAYASVRAERLASGGRVEIRLTADQLSSLERGRAIQIDLDAFHAAGGRRRAL